MKVFLSCMACSKERLDAGGGREWGPPDEQSSYEMNADGIAVGRCSDGHELAVIVQASLYEILFDWACNALLDGYYREAIAGFTTALERFHEFALRVICRSKEVPEDDFARAWKSIAVRSECQYGALLFTYLLDMKEAVPLPPPIAEIRNSVVHHGKLADRKQALEFGRMVYDRIVPMIRSLRTRHAEAFAAEQRHEFIQRVQKCAPNVQRVTHWGASPLIMTDDSVKEAFEAALDTFRMYNPWKRFETITIA